MGTKITYSGSLRLSHSITLSDDILEHANGVKSAQDAAKDVVDRTVRFTESFKESRLRRYEEKLDAAIKAYKSDVYKTKNELLKNDARDELLELAYSLSNENSPGNRIEEPAPGLLAKYRGSIVIPTISKGYKGNSLTKTKKRIYTYN